MKLDNEYFIDSDENNFTLKQIKISGDKAKVSGEERFVVVGYYGNLTSAIQGYVRNSTRKHLSSDIESVLKKLDTINENILLLKDK